MDQNYLPIDGYKQSKLCNILFTNELVHQFSENKYLSHINAYAVSPGIVLTNLGRYVSKKFRTKFLIALFYPLIWYLMKTPRQGAESIIYCAVASNLKQTPGFYYRDCKELKLTPNARNETDAKRLWQLSEKYVEKYL